MRRASHSREIISIQLVLEEDGWAVENLLWDIEQPHNPTGAEYLPQSPAT